MRTAFDTCSRGHRDADTVLYINVSIGSIAMSGMGKDPKARQQRPPQFDEAPEGQVLGGGSVVFTVWESTAEDGLVLDIVGEKMWWRPCIGTEKGVPIVNVEGDENSPAAMTVPDYLEWVFGPELSTHVPKHSSASHSEASDASFGEAPIIGARSGAVG